MRSRKLVALLCCAAMAAGLTGCGGSDSSSATTAAAATDAGTEAGGADEAKEEAPAPAADEETFMIDLATNYAADGPAGVALAKFAEDVAEKSGGSIEISLFTDGTLGSAAGSLLTREVVQGMETGGHYDTRYSNGVMAVEGNEAEEIVLDDSVNIAVAAASGIGVLAAAVLLSLFLIRGNLKKEPLELLGRREE